MAASEFAATFGVGEGNLLKIGAENGLKELPSFKELYIELLCPGVSLSNALTDFQARIKQAVDLGLTLLYLCTGHPAAIHSPVVASCLREHVIACGLACGPHNMDRGVPCCISLGHCILPAAYRC